MILCAGRMESFPFATPVGVGLVESAIHLTRLCLLHPPQFLLFIGTAGSYGEFAPGNIVTSRGAANLEVAFLLGKGYTPLDNVVMSEFPIVSHETIVNSSNYITTDSDISKGFLPHGIGLENMEFFSVLSVAKEFDIPAAGIFYVTNYCNPNAHADFRANHKNAMEVLTRTVADRGFLREKNA